MVVMGKIKEVKKKQDAEAGIEPRTRTFLRQIVRREGTGLSAYIKLTQGAASQQAGKKWPGSSKRER